MMQGNAYPYSRLCRVTPLLTATIRPAVSTTANYSVKNINHITHTHAHTVSKKYIKKATKDIIVKTTKKRKNNSTKAMKCTTARELLNDCVNFLIVYFRFSVTLGLGFFFIVFLLLETRKPFVNLY